MPGSSCREQGRLRCVAIAGFFAMSVALEETQGHEAVEEVVNGARPRAVVLRDLLAVIATDPSVVNSPSSTADSSTFEGQTPMPTCRIRDGSSEDHPPLAP